MELFCDNLFSEAPQGYKRSYDDFADPFELGNDGILCDNPFPSVPSLCDEGKQSISEMQSPPDLIYETSVSDSSNSPDPWSPSSQISSFSENQAHNSPFLNRGSPLRQQQTVLSVNVEDPPHLAMNHHAVDQRNNSTLFNVNGAVQNPSFTRSVEKAAPQSSDNDELTEEDYREMLTKARDVILRMSTTITQMSQHIAKLENSSQQKASQQAQRMVQITAPKPTSGSLEIRVGETLETVWYAERTLPTFYVGVYDHTGLRSDITNTKIQVTMIDGFGNDATQKLSGMQGLVFSVRDGYACICGLRFNCVSSKCGGHFRLGFTLSHPKACCHSRNIQVRSYRLYHAPKLPIDKLQPHDTLAKMRGIGTMYAQRLAAVGVVTIQNLAELDLDGLDTEASRRLMDTLRKDRGALTPAKLLNYIQQARTIVSRHSAEDCSQLAKRQRIEPFSARTF